MERKRLKKIQVTLPPEVTEELRRELVLELSEYRAEKRRRAFFVTRGGKWQQERNKQMQ